MKPVRDLFRRRRVLVMLGFLACLITTGIVVLQPSDAQQRARGNQRPLSDFHPLEQQRILADRVAQEQDRIKSLTDVSRLGAKISAEPEGTGGPAVIFYDAASNSLATINANEPETVFGEIQVTGVDEDGGEDLVGIDRRPNGGMLYGLSLIHI